MSRVFLNNEHEWVYMLTQNYCPARLMSKICFILLHSMIIGFVATFVFVD